MSTTEDFDFDALQRAFAMLPLPSLPEMRDRYVLAIGTCYERWARDSLLIAIAYQQLVNLDHVARIAMTDPRKALDMLPNSPAHNDASYLRACVIGEAARNIKAAGKRSAPVPPAT